VVIVREDLGQRAPHRGTWAARHERLAGALASLVILTLSACGPGPSSRAENTPPVTAEPSPSATPTPPPTPAPATGLVWSDEFDGASGTSLPSDTWTPMDRAGGFGNQELQAYTRRPQNVAHDGNGALRLTARAEKYVDPFGNRVNYTSGRVQTVAAFLHGRIEARIKAPIGTGLWSAFWTFGQTDGSLDWPHVGEIDVMELVDDARTLHADVHANTIDDNVWSAQGQLEAEQSFGAGWHVYRLDWSEDELVFSIDGTEYHTVSRSDLEDFQVWAFERPQHLILNVAVGGTWPQEPTDPTVFPAQMLVDWVRVYDSEVHQPTGRL